MKLYFVDSYDLIFVISYVSVSVFTFYVIKLLLEHVVDFSLGWECYIPPYLLIACILFRYWQINDQSSMWILSMLYFVNKCVKICSIFINSIMFRLSLLLYILSIWLLQGRCTWRNSVVSRMCEKKSVTKTSNAERYNLIQPIKIWIFITWHVLFMMIGSHPLCHMTNIAAN